VISAISWMMRPLVEPFPGGSSELRSGIWANRHLGQHRQNQREQQDSQFH
jgi:hypothetical protein